MCTFASIENSNGWEYTLVSDCNFLSELAALRKNSIGTTQTTECKAMQYDTRYDTIIVGGSYAGLSAAMALGRSMRGVLIIDSGKPCNRQTPHSHNFITQDGVAPGEIAAKAREQVLMYNSVHYMEATVVGGKPHPAGFVVQTDDGRTWEAAKLLFATGVKDVFPAIPGFAECWGISVLHCPYCHGYEVRNKNAALLADGAEALEFGKVLRHWTPNLTICTNGPATFNREQRKELNSLNIAVVENEIESLQHRSGRLERIIFNNSAPLNLSVLFARVAFEQHCEIPAELGCGYTQEGYLEIDPFHETSVPGVFAAGDNTSPLRAVSLATAAGTIAGVAINMELIAQSLS